jgi:hypothetical protein
MGISFNPKDQIKGGLITDVDGTLTNVRIVNPFTYPNSDAKACAIVATLVVDGGDEHEAFWSMGNPEAWEISYDGMEATSVEGKTGMQDSCNAAFFLRELEPAGFPLNKVTDKISFLEGLKAHWIQKAPPKRAGLDNTNARGQERTCLVPEKILKLPWEKEKGGKAPTKTPASASTSKPASTPAASSNGAGDLENEAAVGIASDVLAALKATAPGAHAKTQWGLKVLSGCSANDSFKALPQGAADRTAVQRLLKNAEFLATQEVKMSDKGDVIVPE